MIKDFGEMAIDLSKITRVGKVGGDPEWLRYTVWFIGGDYVEIYDKRQGKHTLSMPRDRFMQMWKSSKESERGSIIWQGGT